MSSKDKDPREGALVDRVQKWRGIEQDDVKAVQFARRHEQDVQAAYKARRAGVKGDDVENARATRRLSEAKLEHDRRVLADAEAELADYRASRTLEFKPVGKDDKYRGYPGDHLPGHMFAPDGDRWRYLVWYPGRLCQYGTPLMIDRHLAGLAVKIGAAGWDMRVYSAYRAYDHQGMIGSSSGLHAAREASSHSDVFEIDHNYAFDVQDYEHFEHFRDKAGVSRGEILNLLGSDDLPHYSRVGR